MNKQNKYYIFALLSFLILPSFLFAEELADSEINEKIEAFILEHPEVIVESINRYEKKMRSENDIRKQEFLQSNREMIFNTSDKMFEGNENGKIKLVEFFDYNCGYCKGSHREIRDLLTEYQDLLVIYKPFPILGPLSLEYARYGLAVSELGKFKEFHNEMFTHKGPIKEKDVESIIEKIGLDFSVVKIMINKTEYRENIKQSIFIAQSLGLQGTPAFVLEDEIINKFVTKEALEKKFMEIR